jgi:hypothetical protein
MIGLKLEGAKRLFFDRDAVVSAVDRGTRKVLSKFGAFVRQRAKTSIKKRKEISEPGQPPSSHTGLLRKNIFFVFSPQTRSVVIGPILLNKGTDAPRLLEYGGTVVRKKGANFVRMTYVARPYMRPAFEKELPNLPDMWLNSVK